MSVGDRPRFGVVARARETGYATCFSRFLAKTVNGVGAAAAPSCVVRDRSRKVGGVGGFVSKGAVGRAALRVGVGRPKVFGPGVSVQKSG